MVAKSDIFLSTYFLLAEPASPDSGKMTGSQSQGMNVNYSTSITLTAIDINVDVLNNLADET